MRTAPFTLLPVFAAAVLLGACDVTVHDKGQGDKADVDIHTPIGDLSVRTDVDSPDSGLAVYPGARPLRDEDEGRENADVNIDTPFFALKVVAAKFEADDAPEKVLDFYRNEMKAHGEVTECRGNIDFKGRRGDRQAVCKERPSSREIQLATGTEEQHRIATVTPRGDGSEFSLVYVQTRAGNSN